MPSTQSISLDSGGVAAIQHVAQQAYAAQHLDDGGLYAIKGNDRTELLETPGYTRRVAEEQAAAPRRVIRTPSIHDTESFINYLAANTTGQTEGVPVGTSYAHGEGKLEVWADVEKRSIVAHLDGGHGWRSHSINFTLRTPRDWEEWIRIDGALSPQTVFAEFIEDHLSSIGAPDGGLLLDVCQTLTAKTKVDFRSSSLLANGQRQFEFAETIEAKAGQKGNLAVPTELTLVLHPFQGAEPVAVTARFRYRIDEGRLFLGVRLAEPETVLEKAFDVLIAQLQKSLPVPILRGIG
uniref:DUF2303 family protein n=1 Tax=Dulem virus 32 TaxID=3145750 RepID=A0AAU8B2P5_9CAUD